MPTHAPPGAVSGDPRRFVTMPMVEECWRITAPLLDLPDPPLGYRAGTPGPAAADALPPGGGWLPLGG